jgi:hypothetical protein
MGVSIFIHTFPNPILFIGNSKLSCRFALFKRKENHNMFCILELIKFRRLFV